jgi:hypothetical protein
LPDQFVTAHKFMLLLLQLGSHEGAPGDQTIGDLVGARILLVPGLKPPPSPPPPPDELPPPPDPGIAQIAGAQQKLASYDQAHRELANAMSAPGALAAAPATKEECEARLAEMAALVTQLEQTGRAERPPSVSGAPVAGAAATKLLLSAALGQALSDNAKSVLAELRFDPGNLNPLFALHSMERQMSLMGTQLASSVRPATYVMLGGVQLEKEKALQSLGVAPWMGRPDVLLKKQCQFQAGIGDLLMVKQNLKAYELGEFAHVENVLAGETREREHRRLDTSEQTITTEQETDTQKEKDLQSTHRNEMQTEANKTVKEQFGLEAGLQVSGSYGPTVSFAAHLNASFSTSSEETQRKAFSFSQEVTEKSSEKITQRIKQTVMHRVLQEIQEINKHAFTNSSSSKHIHGIYRWLNKLYDAQIFNYGQRMMYEFAVPEPAAWFLYAMLNNPPTDSEIVKPVPPTYSGNALKPAHLTRANYNDYVALYQVRGAPAPPPEYLTAAYFDKQDNVDQGSNFGRAGKIGIPDGYEAVGATVMTDYLFTKDKEHAFHIMLGGQPFDATNSWGPAYRDFGARPQELSVSYKLHNAWAFCLGIDVVCRLRSDGFAKWQQQVYDAIMEAYLKQKADYEEKLAVQKMQQGPQQFGRNPLENQRLAKEELKKLVLMMLIGTDDIARNSYYTSTEPLMRLDKACENGSWIRFFENAFAWTNMLYVFYPPISGAVTRAGFPPFTSPTRTATSPRSCAPARHACKFPCVQDSKKRWCTSCSLGRYGTATIRPCAMTISTCPSWTKSPPISANSTMRAFLTPPIPSPGQCACPPN